MSQDDMPPSPKHRLDRRFPELKGTIFIVTYGRSGSTLLQNLLNTIPGAHITGENHNLMETLWQSSRRAWMTRNTWGKTERTAAHPWYGADRIAAARFRERLVDAFIDEILRPPPDARWFGFKEIRYNALGADFPNMLNFMADTFKNPHFIFNSRRAEDVSQSAWWADWKKEDVLKLVETMDARFAAFTEARPEISHRVFYDEIAQDPAALVPLFEKLGEPLDAEKIAAVMETRLTH